MPVGPLFVRVVAAPSVAGGKAIALVADDGEFVGKQISCVVENGINDIATITVRFHVDGERIMFGDNDD